MSELKLYYTNPPKEFFEEETRLGYTITKQMKEVWAIEIDMLACVIQICEKYGIKYFADAGTMLGAVRHGGFVPWDDDIDVMMDRENYDKFIKVCKENHEVQEPYYFTWQRHICLRRRDTTILGKSIHDRRTIFIDIFVFDNVPNNKNERIDYCIEPIALLNDIKQGIIFIEEGWYQYNKYFKKRLNTDYIANLSFGQVSGLDKATFRKSVYDSAIPMKFEYITVNVPVGYDEYFKILYGDDWRIPKQIKSNHNITYFDTRNTWEIYGLKGTFQLKDEYPIPLKKESTLFKLLNLNSYLIEGKPAYEVDTHNILSIYTLGTIINYLGHFLQYKYLVFFKIDMINDARKNIMVANSNKELMFSVETSINNCDDTLEQLIACTIDTITEKVIQDING